MKLMGCVLLSLDGCSVSPIEADLLQHPQTAGVILFKNNYANPLQLTTLTAEIRRLCPHALIAVDQEGGRVQRFLEGFSRLPSMQYWGQRYEQSPHAVEQELTVMVQTMAAELQTCGVSLNLFPVLDLDYGLNPMIGDRSLHKDPQTVTHLARLIVDALHQANMPAVGKHFPGHGGVADDSHQTIPCDSRDLATLMAQDLQPFHHLAHQLDAIMPAHILFPAIDDQHTVGFSSIWLQTILRQMLKFEGVIISDDLTMLGAAGVGDETARATAALAAGCDLLLLGNHRGGLQAMQWQVLQHLVDYCDSNSQQRINRLLMRIR